MAPRMSLKPRFHPAPTSERELLLRARALAGQTLAALAADEGVVVPPDLRRAKGWFGGLLERVLGATAKSLSEPDFQQIGVELKSIPVSRRGVPLETTFVCTIPLVDVGDIEWPESRVYKKLKRVLWVPVLGERQIPVGERRIGTALLWSPTPEQEADLRWDWEELAGLIGRGRHDQITAHLGQFLQVRPKAANSKATTLAHDAQGVRAEVMPRGFYLRTRFTQRVLQEQLVMPSGV